MRGIKSVKLAGVILLALWSSCGGIQAQSLPSGGGAPTNTPLDSWSFYDHTNWTSDLGDAPLSFTNINFSHLGDVDADSFVVDTNLPAWLRFNVTETNLTNLTVNVGSVAFWFAPGSWASTNAGGTGPGEYGRLFEAGAYTTNSSLGWWSIFVDPAGANLYFAAQTNDLSSNITTYISCPISWTTNYFHFVALTYSPTNTALYLDGVLATNGPGVTVYPGADALTNGFGIGSDSSGVYQAHGLFNTVQTYGHPLNSNDVQQLYDWYYPYYVISPYNTTMFAATSPAATSLYGNNLALTPPSLSSNLASMFVVNSAADILYEIQGTTNLAHPNWVSEDFVDGSELTNLTAASLLAGKTGNLFLRIRSWQDTTGTGIPDWWWLQYFGQTTNVDAFANPAGDGLNNLYKFQNGLNPTNFDTPPAPTGLYAYVDATGTNVLLSWNPSPGPVTNYVIYQGFFNPTTYSYSYSQIGQVVGTNVFDAVGAIQSDSDYYDVFDVQAQFPGGNSLISDDAYLNFSPQSPATFNYNIYLTACLVRNATGRWQVMFSGLPTNSAQTIALSWYALDNYSESFSDFVTETDISTANLTNGIYQIPDADVVNLLGDSLSAQLLDTNGNPGQVAIAGVLPNDAPYFVDGRQHLKQNLNFLIRAASIYQPFGASINGTFYQWDSGPYEQSTSLEEFSFLHHAFAADYFAGFTVGPMMVLDNLWPFKANYALENYLVDTSRTNAEQSPIGTTNFNFLPDFSTAIPASPILTHADPYWILQPGFNGGIASDYLSGTNWGVTVTVTNTVASLQSGTHNLFGLTYQTGCEADLLPNIDPRYGLPSIMSIYQPLAVGGSVTVEYPNEGYRIGSYASWCPAPTLNLINYYFAPLINTYGDTMDLPGETDPDASPYYGMNTVQPFPLPIFDDFAVTNQTPPVIVGSIGQPMILGGWAKYAIASSSPEKFAYLGQYFMTNAFVLDGSGNATTNSAGILSPYGEFFPLQAGQAQVVTMPDIDTGVQGTGVVDVVSLNVDANHDGVMDFSYAGPDQNSASRPLHFWVDDSHDTGDFVGTGIPGQGAQGNGRLQINHQWEVHGRRDLVNLFPVCLNIGSLFQSNALSAGISATDTNYQFVLSQADGALRFAYTDLTQTNYMNFLQDTNESGELANVQLITIPASGVPLSAGFLNGLAAANLNIILVQAWTNTTQPLVLTIYHGTNQIAQTQLYLSISGVEQMFRSKTMMLNSTPGTVADRLNDWDVPNEPDTIDKNFVFLHGYNVLPDEARGVAADMFKRLYWSGSHAKFYAVTWEGADTKGTPPFYNQLTPNYHTNVYNAFLTASNLACFLATLSGTNVVAAHSLGNMVTLSAISDWNAPISQYFMMDAAVPIEAIDSSSSTNMMIYSTWTAYSNRLYASDWYQLFPTNDYRSTLFWNNRLGNLRNVDVYNFYSSGEEVLRTSADDPPPSVLGKVFTQLTDFWPFGIPFGTYTWYWQEKGKGTCTQDWFLGSSHGGWLFPLNSYNDPQPLPPATANVLSNSVLQVSPVFTFGSYFDSISGPFPDWALTNAATGSSYAAANRNRILSDAIPAMSLVAGANPIPRLSPPRNLTENNLDMNTVQFQNGWALGRTGGEAGKWHHSDFVQMAYPFTYKLFNQFVTTGNLK